MDHDLCLVIYDPTQLQAPTEPELTPSPVKPGQKIRVIRGKYKNLRGVAISSNDAVVVLDVRMRSKKLIMEFEPSDVRPD